MRTSELAHQGPDRLAYGGGHEVELHWSRPPRSWRPVLKCRSVASCELSIEDCACRPLNIKWLSQLNVLVRAQFACGVDKYADHTMRTHITFVLCGCLRHCPSLLVTRFGDRKKHPGPIELCVLSRNCEHLHRARHVWSTYRWRRIVCRRRRGRRPGRLCRGARPQRFRRAPSELLVDIPNLRRRSLEHLSQVGFAAQVGGEE
jgi:hypothetical protein